MFIKIDGFKYRPVAVGEDRKPGDVWRDGTEVLTFIGTTQVDTEKYPKCSQAYRKVSEFNECR